MRAGGVGWRPHCKSHKSPDIARLQIAAGAIGITCAKLSEAEMLVDAGITDILIANQIVGPIKLERLMRLRRRADIAVAVDGVENVAELARAAEASGVRLRVLIEVDTGTERAGVLPGEPVLALARRVGAYGSLHLAGLMTWEGHTTRIPDPAEKRRAIAQAVGAVVASAQLCRDAGIPIGIVSCGGTGTFETTTTIPGVTEIQAGGGIFGDVRYRTIYNVPVDYALTVLATVTSRPTPTRIIADAGKKAMSTDAGTPFPLGCAGCRAGRLLGGARQGRAQGAERRAACRRAHPLRSRLCRHHRASPQRDFRRAPRTGRTRLAHPRRRAPALRRAAPTIIGMTMTRNSYRLGVDIGGTFTDVVLMRSDGTIFSKKVLSTPRDYSQGIENGVSALLAELDVDAGEIGEFVHATTVATNTIIERKGAKVGIVTTKGFRDVLEIGRFRTPRLYDIHYKKPAPLVERRLRLEVEERVASDGSVVTPLDERALDAAAAAFGQRGRRGHRRDLHQFLRQRGA